MRVNPLNVPFRANIYRESIRVSVAAVPSGVEPATSGRDPVKPGRRHESLGGKIERLDWMENAGTMHGALPPGQRALSNNMLGRRNARAPGILFMALRSTLLCFYRLVKSHLKRIQTNR